jgi:hypothetical protein
MGVFPAALGIAGAVPWRGCKVRPASSSAAHHGSGRFVWVFLGFGDFAAKTLADECWIVLDFLGIPRPNLDFSKGYAGFSGTNFSPPFPPAREAPERARAIEAMLRRGIVHRASITWFLNFCNKLRP